MTTLIRLESPDSRPQIGGALITFDNSLSRIVSWEQDCPIRPTLDAAKIFCVHLIEDLQKAASKDLQAEAAIRDTNWVSITAALQTIISEWNERLVESMRADVGPLVH